MRRGPVDDGVGRRIDRRCGRRSRHSRGRLRVVNIFRVLIRLDGNLITQHKAHFRNRNNDLILDAKVFNHPTQFADALIKIIIAGHHAVIVPDLLEYQFTPYGLAMVGNQQQQQPFGRTGYGYGIVRKICWAKGSGVCVKENMVIKSIFHFIHMFSL